MNIRTVIVDDEPLARASLKEDISLHCPQVDVVAEADSVESAVITILQERPKLVFLDIRLSDGIGFEVVERIHGKVDCAIVFTTAYDQYAIQAFRHSAADYLLKPIDVGQLKEAVNKVQAGTGGGSDAIQYLLGELSRRKVNDRISIPTSEGIHVFQANEIIRCQSESNYSRIFLSNGEKLLAAKTLKDLEELLVPFGFERVHSSHLVNLNHLRKYLVRDGGVLVLSDHTEIPVSQRKKAQIIEMIKNLK